MELVSFDSFFFCGFIVHPSHLSNFKLAVLYLGPYTSYIYIIYYVPVLFMILSADSIHFQFLIGHIVCYLQKIGK